MRKEKYNKCIDKIKQEEYMVPIFTVNVCVTCLIATVILIYGLVTYFVDEEILGGIIAFIISGLIFGVNILIAIRRIVVMKCTGGKIKWIESRKYS